MDIRPLKIILSRPLKILLTEINDKVAVPDKHKALSRARRSASKLPKACHLGYYSLYPDESSGHTFWLRMMKRASGGRRVRLSSSIMYRYSHADHDIYTDARPHPAQIFTV